MQIEQFTIERKNANR